MNPVPKPVERWNAARLLGAAAVVLLALAASAFPELFALDRDALAGGQLWRLWSGHLVHASTSHFAFDVGVAALLVLAFRLRSAWFWMPPVIGLGLLVFYPDLERYYGLSGLLHGLAVLVVGRLALEARGAVALVAWALVAGTLAKATLETATGTAVFTSEIDMGGPVLHGAHLVGSITGMLALAPRAYRRNVFGLGILRAPSATLRDALADGSVHPAHRGDSMHHRRHGPRIAVLTPPR